MLTRNNKQTNSTKIVLAATAGFFVLLLTACATPLMPHNEPASFAMPVATNNASWDPLLNNLPDDKSDQQGGSWFSILNTGQESLYRRLAQIDTATQSIDGQYFLWLEDAVGSLLFERLLMAAERGVRVRLLLDDSFLAGEDAALLAMDEHPNISVRIYNPFVVRQDSMTKRYIENLNAFSRTNHRMHNKLMIADSTTAIVGGRNIADEYFGFGKELNFRDFDVVTTGAAVPELSKGFDVFWNSGWAFPVPEVDHKYKHRDRQGTDFQLLRTDLRYRAAELDPWQSSVRAHPQNWSANWQALAPTMIAGKAHLVQDKPHFETQAPAQLASRIHQETLNTNEEVIAVTAYLVATEGMLETIRQQSEKGVSFRFLTNSLASNNHVAAHTAYRHHRRALLQAGAGLHEVRPDGAGRALYEGPGYHAEQVGLHGKILILDNDRVFIGTPNLDPRSFYLNTEMGLLIESPELNAQVRKAVQPNFSMSNSWRVQLSDEGSLSWHSDDGTLKRQPAGGFGRRIKDFFIGLFPIDSEM